MTVFGLTLAVKPKDFKLGCICNVSQGMRKYHDDKTRIKDAMKSGKFLYGELVERPKEKEEKEAKKRQCLADEFTKVLQTCKEKAKEKERKREEKKIGYIVFVPLSVQDIWYLFAGFTDETPRDYHCNLGPDGRRSNADERPELCRGTVEFVATKEYMVREPMEAVYFVLIDVSMNAIQIGAIYCDLQLNQPSHW
ncbi:hypothetical protein K2173_002825 [Erythroxylum novogranatense]|uniref:Uncharacterized protein n=1 Tax=Erythroxylum novogranatense TaxID=1862640 RepID=A0AAV8SQX3_9ROSI|nr:hypothetical protein K2173_002825 [Erythroxylum novogranatense]